MEKQFEQHILEKFPEIIEKKLLLAISGGLDSIVLAVLCKKIHLDITLAHCNFQLRGKESDDDAFFVQQFAENNQIPLVITSFDTKTYAKEHQLNTQLAARTLRYAWFDKVASEVECAFILTAHHADDLLETFLINIARGTGLKGMLGIPEKNDRILRPLLPFSRQEILEFAQNNRLQWREDSSNATDKYVRNQIRHHIAPKLKEIPPNFLENFLKTQKNLEETQFFIKNQIESLRKELFSKENTSVFYAEKLQNNPDKRFIVYELFKEYGFKADELEKFLIAGSGKQIFSASHRIIQHHGDWILSEKEEKNDKNAVFLINEALFSLENPIKISFSLEKNINKSDKNSIYVDYNRLSFPLKLRKRQEGDYFFPEGQKKQRKLLSKYFKDEKFSVLDKEQQWLLTDNNDNLIWVVGKRADDRFLASTSTEKIVKISIN